MRPAVTTLGAVILLFLASCVFEEPVFESGLSGPASSLQGLWKITDPGGGGRHAALFPLNEHTGLLQYPVATDGWWFEAQSLQVNGRHLLQLRILAGPEAKPAAPGAKNHTLAWLEELPDGTVRMRALNGQAVEKGKFSPTSLRRFLSDPQSDWDTIFGDPSIFRRAAERK